MVHETKQFTVFKKSYTAIHQKKSLIIIIPSSFYYIYIYIGIICILLQYTAEQCCMIQCSSLQDFNVGMEQALFQPFPSEVVFQQFQPQHTYEFPLNLRNNDRVRPHPHAL